MAESGFECTQSSIKTPDFLKLSFLGVGTEKTPIIQTVA